MKAYFTDTGALMVEAENHTERVALKAWHEGYETDGSGSGNSVLGFNWDSYKEPKMYFAGKPAAAVDDGWMPWQGGNLPVGLDLGTMVQVVCRDGVSAGPLTARTFRWEHLGCSSDIIKYRPVPGDE